MTETDTAVEARPLVPGVHRLIRAIEGKEGPFTGALVAFGDTVAVSVDSERLREWAGWAFSDAEHVCGVLDIRRRADGHDALLPWCTQRVEAFLGRRSASDSPLTPGEIGTLVASLLRGVRELGADADAPGEWWLTGDGRPLFVHGEGGSARARTAGLIDRMARHEADRTTLRVLEEIVSALRQPRHPAEDDRRWEEQLFARAAPRALRLDVFAPERGSDVTPRLVAADLEAHAVESKRRRRGADEGGSTRRRRIVAQNDRGSAVSRPAEILRSLAEYAGQRLEMARERSAVRPPGRQEARRGENQKSSRRRSLLLAGSLGAAVLIVGLLWPNGSGDTTAEASSQKAVVSGDTTGSTAENEESGEAPIPEQIPSEAPEVPAEAAAALDAVPALLEAIKECVSVAAQQCPDAVAEGARTPVDGVVSRGADESTETLVDDYGDVAVIRLTPNEEGSAEQMMVLERRDEIWLVRDVYDVAHQPD